DLGPPAKTLWTLARAPHRQALGPCDALSHRHQGDPQRLIGRLSLVANSSVSRQRPLPKLVARLLLVKSQANTAATHNRSPFVPSHECIGTCWSRTTTLLSRCRP